MGEKASTTNHGSLLSSLGNVLIAIPTLLALAVFTLILAVVVYYGWDAFASNFPSFLLSDPYLNMRAREIAPMIFGTFALITGAMAIAVPPGVMASNILHRVPYQRRSEVVSQPSHKQSSWGSINNISGFSASHSSSKNSG
ncbi:MAG: hypothetical protein QXK94_03085 [Candidatus Jordarchaeales archaeon]